MSTKLDILMLSYWDFQECGMQVILRTPLHFARRGHRVTFMVHSEQTAHPSPLVDVHPNVNVCRFQLRLRRLGLTPKLNRLRQFVLYAVRCVAAARRLYRHGRKPDVIYAAEADAVLVGCLLRRIYKAPLVTRFYGIGVSNHFDAQRKKLRSTGLRHTISRMALTRKADMIVVTDDGTNGLDVLRAINPQVNDVKFWRNGIDKKGVQGRDVQALRKSLGVGPERFVLLTVSRLYPWKRVDRAIRALHCLRKAGRRNVTLVVVGHGPEEHNLRRLATELAVDGAVVFAGAVRHDQVYEYYALADVFLSLYDLSNVGNPLWEALNAGRCIVTLNTGGTASVIQAGVNGRLLEVGDDEHELAMRLANTIRELHDAPGSRKRLAEGAKAYAEQHLWTWDERLDAEAEAIEALVNGGSGT